MPAEDPAAPNGASGLVLAGFLALLTVSAVAFGAPPPSARDALASGHAGGEPAAGQNPCDLNGDGVIDSSDVQLAINMALGVTPCNAEAGICSVLGVQRIVNASLGRACVTGAAHSVTLTWAASASPDISGYSVYRGTVAGGPYTRVTPGLIKGTSYVDTAVQAGRTYYYVVTATGADSSESRYSNEASGAVPF
jgi:hypothetical protein